MLENRTDERCVDSTDQLVDLWAEAAAFPVHQSEQALALFLKRLSDLLGACSGSWIAMKKLEGNPRKVKPEDYQVMIDQLDGWAPVSAVYTVKHKNLKSVLGRWLMHARNEGIDAMSKAIAKERGHTRTFIREDVATAEEWENHWISRDFLSHYGIGDRMISMFNIDKHAEACIVMDRAVGDAEFGVEEKKILHLAISGIAGLHKRVFMENGFLGTSAPLSKRERETYRYLLTNLSESQIAEAMKLSIHTVHDYARGVYKKFFVKGRLALMAKVMGG